MDFRYADTLQKCQWIGGGSYGHIYHVTPTIVVKIVHPNLDPDELAVEGHPFLKGNCIFQTC